MSSIGWIDFSSEHRAKVKSALDLLKEKGTLDELGIGQIRDGFAEQLFPGISTIQTRAKYFLIVPRIIRDFQKLDAKSRRKANGLREFLSYKENIVAVQLDKHAKQSNVKVTGIIGQTKIGKGGVSRLPSEIYWNGIRTLGLVNTSLSLADFCRFQDQHSARYVESEEDIESINQEQSNQIVLIPKYDEKWLTDENFNIELTFTEAQLIRDRFLESSAIQHSVPSQLFKHQLANKMFIEENQYTGDENESEQVLGFDGLVERLLTFNQIDTQCQTNLRLALQFSRAIEGPHIRYNIVLARINGFENSEKKYQSEFEAWLEKVNNDNILPEGCEQEWFDVAFRSGFAIRETTQVFITKFFESVRGGESTAVLDHLVTLQAKRNKQLSSLLNKPNLKDTWYGMRRLNYRWGTAKIILQDILRGLHAKT